MSKRSNNQSKKPVKANPAKDKRLTLEQHATMFVDAEKLRQELVASGVPVILATGDLDPNNLSPSAHKKHSGFYFAFSKGPIVPMAKKFDNGKAKSNIAYFEKCQEYAKTVFGPLMGPNETISVEIMAFQNRPYNKLEDHFTKTSIIAHGSIHCEVPTELLTKEGLDKLCQSVVAEGFVVVNKESGERYKLKHENFPMADKPEKKRGPHEVAPTQYSTEGLTLSRPGLGYDNAAMTSVAKGSGTGVTIAKFEIFSQTVDMKMRPIKDVIREQRLRPFDGEKMTNLFVTQGEGPTYRYTGELQDKSIFGKPLEFQLKFDGETALVHKDSNSDIHLLAKVQADVFEIQKMDGSLEYRFGWLK